MKRIGNLYEKIYAWENLLAADKESGRGKKGKSYGVVLYRKKREENLLKLHQMLINQTFKTSAYRTMTIVADRGKIREISKLPYYPDRILHHAIMRVIEPYITRNLINDTYACIKGKGLSYGVKRVQRAMADVEGTRWCLKTDIHKFYPSIDQEATISDLKRKFKDEKLISLLSEIIRSTPSGLPIGLYTSQLIANFAMSRLDHFIKEDLEVKYYFRYCDDMVFFGDSKERMKQIKAILQEKLENELHLHIKPNFSIFPVGVEHKDETKSTRKRKRGAQRKIGRFSRVQVHTPEDIASKRYETKICA